MNWQQTTIDEACSLVTDGTHYTPPDVGQGIPFLTVKDFSNDGHIDLVGCSHITEDEFEKADKGNSAPKPGDVLFSKDGTVGKVYVVVTRKAFAVLSSLAILRPDASRLDASYFGWVLKTDNCLTQAAQSKTGSAIRRIILKDLKRVRFPLPPLAEQKRIARILDAADALRTKRREALAQLDTLLQSTFLDMFGDPATNPLGWPVGRLEHNFSKTRAGTCCGPFGSALKKHEYVEDGIPVWGIDNVKPNQFSQEQSLFITPEKFAELCRYSVEPGDILISRAGTVGRMCVAMPTVDQSVIGTNLIRLALDSDAMLPVFFASLYTYCGERLSGLRASGDDRAYSFLNTTRLKSLMVPLPPLDLQHRFAAMVQSVEQQKTRQRAHLAELDTLFASLQSRAFRGDL